MKKVLFILLMLLVGAATLRMAILYRPQPVQAAQVVAANTEYQSPVPQATWTPIPSATVGYQETAVLAQQTAWEAIRVNAQITAEHEQRILNELQLTAAIESQNFQMQSWTATVALTSIPLTATQQVLNNTQVANSQSIIAGQLTATHQAPTQMAAIINIRNMEKFAKMDHGARTFFMVSSGLALLALVAWFVRNPILPKPEPEETESVDHVEVWLRNEQDKGAKSEHYIFPCSQEQLTELAEMVANGERTFGYNRMERTSQTFRGQRETLEKVRAILEKAKLATNTHAGESVINERGVEFFELWFGDRQLPEGFEIAEMEAE